MKRVDNSIPEQPFWIVELPNDDAARKIASRSISIRCILELWSNSKTVLLLHENVKKYLVENKELVKPLFTEDKSFKITVETYNKHFTHQEKVDKIEYFDYLPIQGSVNLKTPDTQWWYIEYYGLSPLNIPDEPEDVIFGKWIADGQRSLIKDLSLKTRKFIGNTSMDPQLSLIMSNQALVSKGDLVFDPFVGTGSLLVCAAKFGAYVMGTDIDYMMLHAKNRPSRITQKVREKDESIRANLVQYNCEKQYLDVLVSDFSSTIFKDGIVFDSIITDPPYGIREATEKVQSKKKEKKTKTNDSTTPHFPSTSNYDLHEIFRDLLVFSAKHLKLNGRLVCFFPCYREDYIDEMIPRHNCLHLVSNSEQVLSNVTSRRLLTYEKISEYSTDEKNTTENQNYIDFRERYFCHGEDTRQERRMKRAELREHGKQEALKRGKMLDENGKVYIPNYRKE